jgi:N-acetylmuramoyl-L-alanine amidase
MRYAWLALVLAVSGPLPGLRPGPTGDPAVGRVAEPLAGRTVVLDPGHQLGNSRHLDRIERPVWIGNGTKACNTTGTATNAGFPEATFAWRVAQLARASLRRLGARVIMTRTSNSLAAWGPCVDVRGRRGNHAHADLKLSIHGDGSYAPGAHGFHVIYAPDHGLTADTYRGSRAYALVTRAAMQRAGFRRANYIAGGDGLDVRSDLGTLNLSNMPTVMVECGNMRNAGDAARMTSRRGEARLARALVKAIRAFLATR